VEEFGVVPKMNAAEARCPEGAEAPVAAPRPQPAAWPAPGAEALESPARRLQLELEQSWAAPETARWSSRRALAFIFVTNAVIWTGVVAGLRALFF
jgi:hypothetical protein